jgi:ABC-type methionine transport system ATPase subunit
MSIAAGEIFGFLGASGAGKTTTIRMLCGLTMLTSGSAFIRTVWTCGEIDFAFDPNLDMSPRDSASTPI